VKQWMISVLALLAPGIALAAPPPGLEALAGTNRALMLVMPEAGEQANRDAQAVAQCDGLKSLSDSGRAKAERIGAALRDAGFGKALVFTSPSCTAVQAGKALQLGSVDIQPLLQDLVKTSLSRNRQREEFGLFLADFYGTQSIVLITHRNNILDLSEHYIKAGNGIILRINLNGDVPKVLGIVQFE
jgi:phosphohistidine phosphatase SixA